MRRVVYTQNDGWPARDQYADHHVLTYAEEGFSPLNMHGEKCGLDRQHLAAFADGVNERSQVGTLHPSAPITALPRALIRDLDDAFELERCIREFLNINGTLFKAQRLIFDFRCPGVPAFVMAAIDSALQSVDAAAIEEVVIIDNLT